MKNLFSILYKLPFIIILLSGSLFGQKTLNAIKNDIKNKKYESAIKGIKSIDTTQLLTIEKADYYLVLAELFKYENKEYQSFKKLLEAKEIYIKIDSIEKALKLNFEIAYLVSSMKNKPKNINEEELMKEYLNYALKTRNKTKTYISPQKKKIENICWSLKT